MSGIILVEYPKQQTREERFAESQRKYQESYAAYEIQHHNCPQCGKHEQLGGRTTMGCPVGYDQNRTSCGCGWRGIVHDLTPKA